MLTFLQERNAQSGKGLSFSSNHQLFAKEGIFFIMSLTGDVMRINTLTQGSNVSTPITSEVLDKLKTGDVIRARIIEKTSKELVMRLFDGTELTAMLTNDIEGKPGDYFTLLVKGKMGNLLVMEPVISETSQSQDEIIRRELMRLGIRPDDQAGIDLLRELQTGNITYTKEDFTSLLDALKSLKGLTPEKAVFLYKNRLDFSNESLEALNRIVDGRFKLGKEIDEISRLLNDIVGDWVNMETDGFELQKHDFAVFLNSSENIVNSAFKHTDDNNAPSAISHGNGFPEVMDQKDMIRSLLNDTKDIQELKNSLSILTGNKAIGISTENSSSELGKLLSILDGHVSESMEDSSPVREERLMASNESMVKDELADAALSSPESRDRAVIMKKIAFLKKELEDLYIDLSKQREKNKASDLEELHKKMLSKLTELEETLKSLPLPKNQELINRMENIRNNISFMNDIYANSVYFQIPIKLPDKNTTAELYILKKGSKKISPEKATLLIALETEHMGMVETLVSIRGKSVNLNIRVERQEIVDFLKENNAMLFDHLESKGYKLADIKYCISNEKVDLLNVEKVITRVTMENTSVDYRI